MNFENENLRRDLREIGYIINDKDKLIQDIYVENEKLIADNKLKNRYCNCVKTTNEVVSYYKWNNKGNFPSSNIIFI